MRLEAPTASIFRLDDREEMGKCGGQEDRLSLYRLYRVVMYLLAFGSFSPQDRTNRTERVLGKAERGAQDVGVSRMEKRGIVYAA